VNAVTARAPSFLRKQEPIFSALDNSQMDAVFQRHDVRNSGAEKVTYEIGNMFWSCAPKVHNTIARGTAPGKWDGCYIAL